MNELVIIGAGQHGRNCLRLAKENGIEVCGFVDDYQSGYVEGIKVYRAIEYIPDCMHKSYIVAFGEIGPRKKYIEIIKGYGLKTINLIDKCALIEDGAKIGTGNYIGKLAIIYASAKIGDNNIINCKSVVAADDIIGNNVNVSLGCNICSGVEVKDDTYIGCQASVIENIGRNCKVGAGSVVLRCVPDNTFVAGSPAKVKGFNKE